MNSELKAFVFGMVGVSAVLAAVLVLVYRGETGPVVAALAARSPLLLTGSPDFSRLSGGFAANILISLWAMLLAGAFGTALGIALIAQSAVVRTPAVLVMNILRNSPWLVVLYAMLYLLPFEIDAFGQTWFLSPTVKASSAWRFR
jgi:polar amino acid transport system permease protein